MEFIDAMTLWRYQGIWILVVVKGDYDFFVIESSVMLVATSYISSLLRRLDVA